jgi:hypothetical protein
MHYRKIWLSLIAFGLLLPGLTANAESSLNAQVLTGTWLMKVTPDPGPQAPPPFTALITFTGDHNFVSTETDEQVITQGIWARTGDHQFSLTGYQFEFEVLNIFNGTFKVRAKFTLDRDGEHFDGRYRVDFYDPNGNLLFSGDGGLAGNRIHLEPMP